MSFIFLKLTPRNAAAIVRLNRIMSAYTDDRMFSVDLVGAVGLLQYPLMGVF